MASLIIGRIGLIRRITSSAVRPVQRQRPFAIRITGAAPELGAALLALPGDAQHHRPPALRAARKISISPIGRIRPIHPLSMRQPRGRKLFGVASALDELPLQPHELLVEQVVRLVDQAQERIRHHRRVVVLQLRRVEGTAGASAFIRRIGQIGRIRRIGPIPKIRPIRLIEPILLNNKNP